MSVAGRAEGELTLESQIVVGALADRAGIEGFDPNYSTWSPWRSA